MKVSVALLIASSLALAFEARADDPVHNWGARYTSTPKVLLGDFLEPEFAAAVNSCPVNSNLAKLEEKLTGKVLSRIPREVYNARQAQDFVMSLRVSDIETAKLLRGMQRVFTTSDKAEILKQMAAGGGRSVLDETIAIPGYEPSNSTTYNSDCSLLARSMNKASVAFGVNADAVLNAETESKSAVGFSVGFVRHPIEDLILPTTPWSKRRTLFEGLWEIYKDGEVTLYYPPRARAASLVSRTAISSGTEFKATLSYSGGIGPFSFSTDNKVAMSDSAAYTSNSAWSYLFQQPSAADKRQYVPQFDTLRQLYSRATVAKTISKELRIVVLRSTDGDGPSSGSQLELDRYDRPTVAVEVLYRDGSRLPQGLCESAGWSLSVTGADKDKLPSLDDAPNAQKAAYKSETKQCVLSLFLKGFDAKTPTDKRLALRLHGESSIARELSIPDTELALIVRNVFAIQESSPSCTGAGESFDCTTSIDLFLKNAVAGDSIDYSKIEVESVVASAVTATGDKMPSVVVEGRPVASFSGSRGKLSFHIQGGGWPRANIAYVLKVPRGKNGLGVSVAGNQFAVIPGAVAQ